MGRSGRAASVLVGMFAALTLVVASAAPAMAAPGDLDPSFGQGGVALTPIGSSSDGFSQVDALAVQADGKLVAAGSVVTTPSSFDAPPNADVALARYSSGGVLDTTFGNNGTVVADLGGFDGNTHVAVQPDGKVVIAATSVANITADMPSAQIVIARYTAAGAPDQSFGLGGKVQLKVGEVSAVGGLALQPDGAIVVVG